jgi:hypothetical protein
MTIPYLSGALPPRACDMINPTVVNAQPDDRYTFTLDAPYSIDLSVQPNATGQVASTASQAGIFTFICDVRDHRPYMRGTLVVLPASLAPAG